MALIATQKMVPYEKFESIYNFLRYGYFEKR